MPLVPISTGGNSAISFCVACGKDGGCLYALYCWCQGERKSGIEVD